MAGYQDRDCEVCQGPVATSKRIEPYCVSEWPVVECETCNFVYLKDAPDYSELETDHAWEKNIAKEAVRRKKKLIYKLDYATRARLKVGKYLETVRTRRVFAGGSGRVLDVGCGNIVKVPDGFEPYGIEISDGLYAEALPLFHARGGDVFHGPAVEGLASYDDDFFSGIVMRSYLEHEVQPRKVLEEAFRVLEPGGAIQVKVPNYGCLSRSVLGVNWCGFRFPDHVNYFTNETLGKLARSIGYEYRLQNLVAAFDDNIFAVLRKPDAVAAAA